VGPALDIYEDAARSAGADVSYSAAMDTDGFVFDMSSLQKNIRNIDLVFLANPNRISGTMIPSKTICEAINRMPPGSPHFVIDESLTEFAGNDNCCDDMLNKGNFTLLRTTAYFYGCPGLSLPMQFLLPIVFVYTTKRSIGTSIFCHLKRQKLPTRIRHTVRPQGNICSLKRR